MTTVTLDQRLEALNQANMVRFGLRDLKRSISDLPPVEAARLVADTLSGEPDALVGAAKIGQVIGAIGWMGIEKTRKFLDTAGVRSADRRVRSLSARQRRILAYELRAWAATRPKSRKRLEAA